MTSTSDAATAAYEILLVGGTLDWSDRGRIEVTGGDRHSFLHAFCTNEIKRLKPGDVCEAFFCQANGKIVGHGFIECEETRLVIDTVSDQVEPLCRHLDRYIIREEVRLTVRTGERHAWLFLGAAGERLKLALNAVAPDDSSSSSRESPRTFSCDGITATWRDCPWESPARTVIVSCAPTDSARLLPALRNLVADHVRAAGVETKAAELMTAPLDQVGRDLWRVLTGFPLYGLDITTDNLPQEVGRDAQAINFNKGCYLGQEPVARIDAMGHVNWELVRFAAPAAEVGGDWTRGATLTVQEKPAVRLATVTSLPPLRSVVGLAYVRRELRRLARPQMSCPVSEGVLVTSAGELLINPDILKH